MEALPGIVGETICVFTTFFSFCETKAVGLFIRLIAHIFSSPVIKQAMEFFLKIRISGKHGAKTLP